MAVTALKTVTATPHIINTVRSMCKEGKMDWKAFHHELKITAGLTNNCIFKSTR